MTKAQLKRPLSRNRLERWLYTQGACSGARSWLLAQPNVKTAIRRLLAYKARARRGTLSYEQLNAGNIAVAVPDPRGIKSVWESWLIMKLWRYEYLRERPSGGKLYRRMVFMCRDVR